MILCGRKQRKKEKRFSQEPLEAEEEWIYYDLYPMFWYLLKSNRNNKSDYMICVRTKTSCVRAKQARFHYYRSYRKERMRWSVKDIKNVAVARAKLWRDRIFSASLESRQDGKRQSLRNTKRKRMKKLSPLDKEREIFLYFLHNLWCWDLFGEMIGIMCDNQWLRRDLANSQSPRCCCCCCCLCETLSFDTKKNLYWTLLDKKFSLEKEKLTRKTSLWSSWA